MAEKRMFTQKIIDSDAFVSMPSSAQALYLHINMQADDDGFCNKINDCMSKAKASSDDCNLLILKNFIIPFSSGVSVVKHWRMHNTLRKDRYHETDYTEEKAQLYIKQNGVYTLDSKQGVPALVAKWLPNGCQMVGIEQNSCLLNNSIKEINNNASIRENIISILKKSDTAGLLDMYLNQSQFKDYTNSVIDNLSEAYLLQAKITLNNQIVSGDEIRTSIDKITVEDLIFFSNQKMLLGDEIKNPPLYFTATLLNRIKNREGEKKDV